MAELEISIVPIGTSTSSVSSYIAECLKVLKKEKVKYSLNSMGTVIEGDLDDLLTLARKMHQAPFRKGIRRVVTTIRIDDRRDRKHSGKAKVASVRRKLNGR